MNVTRFVRFVFSSQTPYCLRTAFSGSLRRAKFSPSFSQSCLLNSTGRQLMARTVTWASSSSFAAARSERSSVIHPPFSNMAG